MTRFGLFDSAWLASKSGGGVALAGIIAANYFVTGFLVQDASLSYNGLNVHVYDALFGGVMAASILLFSNLSRLLGWSQLTSNLATWLSASTATAIVAPTLLSLFTAGPAPGWIWESVPATITSLLASCLVFTLLIAGINEGRANLRLLRRAQLELVAVRSFSADKFDRFAAELRNPVRERVLALVSEAKSTLLVQASKPADVSDRLFAFLNSELRPLMSALADGSVASTEQLKVRSRKLPKLARSVNKVTFSQSQNPVAICLIIGLYMVPSMAFFGGQAGLFAELLVLATAATLWMAVSTLVGKQSGDWRLWALLNGLLFGFSTLLLVVYSGLFGEPLTFDIVVATSVSSGLMAAVASSLQSLIVRRSSIATATESINATLREAVAAMDARIVQLRTNVSRHFHNQVQAKIVALALKLSAEPALDDGVRAQAAAGLEEIEQALDVSEQKAVAFEAQVAQLAEFWQGALELEMQLDPAAAEILNADANLAARVVEVMREGLTNAAKHSTDGKVTVALERDGSQVLLRMTNLRFDGLETLAPTGIGAATIGEASTSFTSGPQGERFVLEARFE